MKLSTDLEENIRTAHRLLPLGTSFDLVTRRLYLGKTKGYWIGVNGFLRVEILQQIFSDLQNPLYTQDQTIDEIQKYVDSRIGYVQTSLSGDWDDILRNLLSGPSLLLLDGFDRAVLLDVRTYPARSISEPDSEKVTKGARDGFVETLLFNANLMRRRIRDPRLTFELASVGSESKTDVAVSYLKDVADMELVKKVKEALSALPVTALTMGAKSLEELLVRKKWFHLLPSIFLTERPDVACSYLTEGHIAVIVDNSPAVLIFPCTIFQFTQSPEDYYKNTVVGTYFRLVRFLCIPVSLLLMPLFLLLTVHYPQLSEKWNLLSTQELPGPTLIFYMFAVEFLLDLFRYSATLRSGQFSGSLSIIGGLIIGDMAVELNWASMEILFYAAVTMLASLSLSSLEFGDGIRLYRIFLLIVTAFGGLWGFSGGLLFILLSVLTTPTFGGKSYLWPLLPFNWQALKTLLFRYPAAKAQPDRVWKRR